MRVEVKFSRLLASCWRVEVMKGGAGGFSCLLALPLAQGACPPFSPLFLPEDRFSPYLIQLSPCCILPD